MKYFFGVQQHGFPAIVVALVTIVTLKARVTAFCPPRATLSVSPPWRRQRQQQHAWTNAFNSRVSSRLSLANVYDDWELYGVLPESVPLPLEEESVEFCLNLFKDSDRGQEMFGCNALARSIGITGNVMLVDIVPLDNSVAGEVVLSLHGAFWHKRATVFGTVAAWLAACIPDIASIQVDDGEALQDLCEIVDPVTGEWMRIIDKRSPDWNGMRDACEYQGLDPDVVLAGPFANPTIMDAVGDERQATVATTTLESLPPALGAREYY